MASLFVCGIEDLYSINPVAPNLGWRFRRG